MHYITRRIYRQEMQSLDMWSDDENYADEGWALVQLDGDDETVVDWYADRYLAVQEADHLNCLEEEAGGRSAGETRP
jgi:hypothetical protein